MGFAIGMKGWLVCYRKGCVNDLPKDIDLMRLDFRIVRGIAKPKSTSLFRNPTVCVKLLVRFSLAKEIFCLQQLKLDWFLIESCTMVPFKSLVNFCSQAAKFSK